MQCQSWKAHSVVSSKMACELFPKRASIDTGHDCIACFAVPLLEGPWLKEVIKAASRAHHWRWVECQTMDKRSAKNKVCFVECVPGPCVFEWSKIKAHLDVTHVMILQVSNTFFHDSVETQGCVQGGFAELQGPICQICTTKIVNKWSIDSDAWASGGC